MTPEELEARYSAVRDPARWRVPIHYHASVAAMEQADALPDGLHTAVEAGIPIDSYIKLEPGQPLVVFFNGNKQRKEDFRLPAFLGFSVLPKTGISRLCMNDPSLYLDPALGLGWYAGSETLPVQQLVPRIIAKVASLARTDKIILTGGSGGGFAAMLFGRLVPESLTLVWNPQTNLLEYHKRHVQQYARAAFGLEPFSVVRSRMPRLAQVEVRSLYAQRQPNRVLYLQNDTDWHVQSHLAPLLQAMGASPEARSRLVRDDLYLHVTNWGEGHDAPPKDFLSVLYKELLAWPGTWEELLTGGALPSIFERVEQPVTPAETQTPAAAT